MSELDKVPTDIKQLTTSEDSVEKGLSGSRGWCPINHASTTAPLPDVTPSIVRAGHLKS